MDIHVAHEGKLPIVRWTQAIKRETLYDRIRRRDWIERCVAAIVLAGISFYWVGLYFPGSAIPWFCALLCLCVGFAASPPPFKSEGAIDNAARIPIIKYVRCEARILFDSEGNAYLQRTIDGSTHLQYRLSDVNGFLLGGTLEWFGSTGQPSAEPDTPIIVVDNKRGSVKIFAEHNLGRADLARLHAVLTEQFVVGRSAYLEPLVEEKRTVPEFEIPRRL